MTDRLRSIAPKVHVAGQLGIDDIASARAMGIERVVNNRPDGEDPNQPDSPAVEQAVRDAGLDYVHLPVVGLPSPDQIQAAAALLADGRATLLYCRSGMRSAALWAMATATAGRASPEGIRNAAAQAGYDLTRLPL